MNAETDLRKLPEPALLEICIEGRDRDAYSLLVERYQGLLCSLAYSIVGDLIT